MKKYWFERILFGVIALLLLVVCATGYTVFSRLDQVANTPLPTAEDRNSQTLIQDINLNLLKSENLIYSYIYQNQNEALLEFEILKSRTLRQIGYLKNYQQKNETYQHSISEILRLTAKKFDNQKALMQLRNEDRVKETMQLVEDEVQQVDNRTQLELQIREEANNQSSAEKDESKRKSRKERKQETENKQLTNEVQHKEVEKIATQNSNVLKKKINNVRVKAVNKEINLNKTKLFLEQNNVQLSKNIDDHFETVASIERIQLVDKTKQAKAIAAKTNTISITFSLISTILIGLIVLLIIYLFRKAKESNTYLKQAKDKSDLLTEAKSRFLATMSHEIRTPLNAISGFTEQLAHDKLSVEAEKKVSIIRDSSKHLMLIINEILDLSKLEENNIQLDNSAFYPLDASKKVVEQFSVATQEQGNQLILKSKNPTIPAIIGDELRFKQILINLIGNANKFTKSDKIEVELEYTISNVNASTLLIQVKDHGIGMSPSQLERIFEPFEQAETSTSRKYGGTGLGLSITKKIVQKMGGIIDVNSQEGEGTCFEVKLPVHTTEIKNDEVQVGKTEFTILQNKHVLVVDDEPFNRLLLKGMFKKSKAILFEASNGIEAIEKISSHPIDIILLDVQMPEMNGEEFVQYLKDENKLSQYLIIGLTATLDEEIYHQMLERGWNDVLIKPIQPEKLNEKLINHLE